MRLTKNFQSKGRGTLFFSIGPRSPSPKGGHVPEMPPPPPSLDPPSRVVNTTLTMHTKFNTLYLGSLSIFKYLHSTQKLTCTDHQICEEKEKNKRKGWK